MKLKFLNLVAIFILSFNLCGAQIHERVDSVVNEICKSLNEYDDLIDSQTVSNVFHQHLFKYVSKMSQDAAERTIEKVDIRLQITCQKYVDYVSSFHNDYWHRVKECPRTTLSDLEIKRFFQITHFKYVEGNGDTTDLKLTQKEWIDYMKDGTYSKLSLVRTSPTDFVISFIESNNAVKTNMSRLGDKYYYSIISKGRNFYTLCASVRGLNGGSLFKLFYR
jgi:hypothetical protein